MVELTDHIDRTYEYGGDIPWMIENEKTLDIPKPTDDIDTSTTAA